MSWLKKIIITLSYSPEAGLLLVLKRRSVLMQTKWKLKVVNSDANGKILKKW
jgi:hypothetical protein